MANYRLTRPWQIGFFLPFPCLSFLFLLLFLCFLIFSLFSLFFLTLVLTLDYLLKHSSDVFILFNMLRILNIVKNWPPQPKYVLASYKYISNSVLCMLKVKSYIVVIHQDTMMPSHYFIRCGLYKINLQLLNWIGVRVDKLL